MALTATNIVPASPREVKVLNRDRQGLFIAARPDFARHGAAENLINDATWGRACLYALAASFFHVIFEKEPFRFGAQWDKHRGLNWEGLDRSVSRMAAETL